MAYAADSGEALWEFPTQTGVIAPPVTFQMDGEQYISVLAGWGGAFGLAAGLKPPPGPARSRILTFKLGGDVALPPVPERVEYDPPPRTGASEETLQQGSDQYHRWCAGCHGNAAVSGGVLPDLRFMHPSRHESFKAIVLGGALKGAGMVSFADQLTEKDAEAIHAYIIEEGNEALETRAESGWWQSMKRTGVSWFGALLDNLL
jgi:quinohemoprotein ethanol dehydrogenase